jgi:hypothetical protein
MHLEFQPADAPDPADPDAQFGVPPEQITTELLELCEQFFRQASPTVRTELRQFLTEHGHRGGLGWFLDALGFTTLNYTALANNLSGAAFLGDHAADTSGDSPVPH